MLGQCGVETKWNPHQCRDWGMHAIGSGYLGGAGIRLGGLRSLGSDVMQGLHFMK